jgi:Na+/melibiose symporter-like transporter
LVLSINNDYIIAVLATLLIALAYSIIPSTIWPSVALLIDDDELATGKMFTKLKLTPPANGLMVSIQNCGLALTNLMVGWLADTYSYNAAMLMFALMDIFSGFVASVLTYLDWRGDQVLLRPLQEEHKQKITDKPYVVLFI